MVHRILIAAANRTENCELTLRVTTAIQSALLWTQHTRLKEDKFIMTMAFLRIAGQDIDAILVDFEIEQLI
jgi:hypothetical protein